MGLHGILLVFQRSHDCAVAYNDECHIFGLIMEGQQPVMWHTL